MATAAGGWLEVQVRDRGAGFAEHPSDRSGLGMGLSLIGRLSAEMSIAQGGSGTEVRMRFNLPRR